VALGRNAVPALRRLIDADAVAAAGRQLWIRRLPQVQLPSVKPVGAVSVTVAAVTRLGVVVATIVGTVLPPC
jgi:hypothetical protein